MAKIQLGKKAKQFFRYFLLALVATFVTGAVVELVKGIVVVGGIVSGIANIPTFGIAVFAGLLMMLADYFIDKIAFLK